MNRPRIRYDINNGVWLCGRSYGGTPLEAYGQWFMMKRINEVSIESNNNLLRAITEHRGVDEGTPSCLDFSIVQYPLQKLNTQHHILKFTVQLRGGLNE